MDTIQDYLIGFDGEQVVSSDETRKQIDAVRALQCALQHEGEALNWDHFDDPKEQRTLFQYVLGDRRHRVDNSTLMADRPPIAVVSAVDAVAVRLQFYEGHDALALTYDLRSAELQDKQLPRFLDEDPHAYDPAAFGFSEEFTLPAAFLQEAFGFPEGEG